jgi:hypothetical protein
VVFEPEIRIYNKRLVMSLSIPHEILDRLSRHCPHAISTYVTCIAKSDKKGKCFFSRENITIDMSESWTKFKNNLKDLSRENLIEWVPIDGGLAIGLIDEDYSDECEYE